MGKPKRKPMVIEDLAKKLSGAKLVAVAVQPGDGLGEALADIAKMVNEQTPIKTQSQLLRHIAFDYRKRLIAELKQGAA